MRAGESAVPVSRCFMSSFRLLASPLSMNRSVCSGLKVTSFMRA